MICEQCKAEGKTSRVTGLGGSRTLMYCAPYYDEEGRRHHHDFNITTSGYECSNGHHWETQSRGTCWCGWKGDA